MGMKEIAVQLYDILHKLTLHEACWLLKVYGFNEETIWYNRSRLSLDINSFETAQRFSLAILLRLVGFYGGPIDPNDGQRKWLWGSLLALVVDRIVYAYAYKNIDYKWLFFFEPWKGTYLQEQLTDRIPDALKQKTFNFKMGDNTIRLVPTTTTCTLRNNRVLC